MKSRFTWLGIIAVVFISIATFFIACDTTGVNDVVVYKGQVVYINTTTPFPDLTVKITDGRNTHCQTETDAGGFFSLKVRVSEIDGNYYLLAGDSTCVPKKVALGGYGQAEVDLGVIEVEGPTLPTVTTDKTFTVQAETATLGGNVTSDGRLAVTARGICYGKEQEPSIKGLHTTDGTGKGEFTSNLKDLEHNTIYYARAYATNRMGTAYGEQVKFTTEEGVPIVITDSVYRIAAHSARCKGHVESDGGYAVSKKGTCWSRQPDPTVDDDCTNEGSGKGEFTSSLSNLIENTTYYVRTYATNSTATVYGEQMIITTLDGLAVVKTDSINAVTATGFSAHGTVVSDCDIPVTARGFCYSTSQYPTIENEHTTIGKGLGSFKSVISGLKYSTTYYIRAYATNATGTTYGEQKHITTLNGLPSVTTAEVTNIGSVRATCGGEVTDDGTLTIIARGVCYGTEQQPTIEGLHTSDGKGLGKFTSSLKDLKDKTIYYVRAYATTDAGTAYGEERTFKTENGVPVVLLDSVGEPTANSVTCFGNVTGDGGVTLTERGFCYGLTQYPTNTSDHIAIGTGVGEFTGNLTGLALNTTYYIRAYAVNSLGVGYSEQQSFTTKNGLPIVITGQSTATATTITAGGEITDNGGFVVTERGVCYSATNAEPSIIDGKVVGGKGNGTFNVSITDLSAATSYYVRAYATNENGTSYGETLTIVTKDGVAVVSAGEITNVTALTATGSVTVTDAGGATLQSCGICWSVNPYPTTGDSSAVAGGKQLNTAYTCNISNLQPNTTYYLRAYATTDITTSYSEQVTFKTTTGLPVVETGSATPTASTITIAGEVTSNGGYAVTERGVCYSATNAEPTISDKKVTSGSGNGSFSASISNLEAATTYYIRAYATNSIGTSYGNTISVTTKDGSATVTLGEITNITALTATGSVTVTDAGGATLQSCGICWSMNPNPTIEDNKAIASGKQINTTYTCNMSELQPNAKYYVRAYATTDVTTIYSTSKTFTTITGLPVVSTGSISSTAASLTCAGEVTNDAGYSVSERGICYSRTNSEPTILDTKAISGSGKGTFSVTISALQPSTSYYVRAYAINTNGTAYGAVVPGTTKSGTATVTTGVIGSIKAISATGSVTVSDVDGSTLQSCGICWSTTPNPTTADSKAVGGNQLNTKYTCNISSLTPNTAYYVRAYAVTEQTTTYGGEVSFTTTVGLPTIALNSIQALTKSLIVNASVSSDGGYSVTKRGVCWSATNGNPTIADSYSESGTGTGSYSITISNLQANSTYYVRAYAQNEIGIVYSDVQTQKTGTGLQGVHFDTNPISDIKGGSAICKVIVDYIYTDVPITGEGVCWSSTTTTPTIDDSKTNEGQSTTSFTSTLTNLTPLTTYYVRAYVTTSYGTAYSSTYASFTTMSGLPTVTTNEITTNNVTNTSFVCGGEVTDIGDAPVTARGICWNTTGTPTISDSHSSSGSGLGSFTHTIAGVSTTSQTYYVRAYATNKYGTSYGEVVVQNKNNPYHLPVYEIDGVNYMIYPQDLGEMTWTNANSTCENLTAYGFSDWRLMTKEEANQLHKSTSAKSNFILNGWYWTSTKFTDNFSSSYYVCKINSSSTYSSDYISYSSQGYLKYTRPIRIMIQ